MYASTQNSTRVPSEAVWFNVTVVLTTMGRVRTVMNFKNHAFGNQLQASSQDFFFKVECILACCCDVPRGGGGRHAKNLAVGEFWGISNNAIVDEVTDYRLAIR